MKRILLTTVIACFVFTFSVKAQYDIRLSQYYMARTFYNPAYAGSTENLSISALSRIEWLGIHGAPKSFFVAADRPFKFAGLNTGIGLVVFTEGVGLFQNTHAAAQFAVKQKLLGGTLSVGFQFGLASESFDGTKVYIPQDDYHQQVDGAIPTTKVSGQSIDMNAGVYYQHTNYYVGIGASHILKPEIQLGENAATYIARAYNLMGGYNIKMSNPLYELQPSVFVLTDLKNFHTDITARVEYNKMFNGGFSWRPNESVGMMFGANLGRFQVGYAYDYPTTALGRATTGSHELFLKYNLKLNKTKTGKNRHKSVRIL